MKKLILAAMTLIAASSSFGAQAVSRSIVCNGCSPQQTLDRVRGSAYGDWYVHDMLNRRITHYSIMKGMDIDRQVIKDVPITPAVQQQFNWIQELYDTTQTLNIQLRFNASGAIKTASVNTLHIANTRNAPLVAFEATAAGASMSAFDLINTPANQRTAINYMISKPKTEWMDYGLPLQTALATFTSRFAITQAIYPGPVIIQVTMEFNDGSTSKATWNINSNQWEYTLGSSLDAVGNPIPENPSQAVGVNERQNYVYPNTPDGVNAALRAAHNFRNIGLPVNTPVFRSGSNWIVACVRVGGPAGSVSCTGTPM